MTENTTTIEKLNSFDPSERSSALETLAKSELPPLGTNVNMHLHSFFSYNAEGYSPSRLAWEARNAGMYAAGLCDFDVLDGQDEFLNAGLTLGLRTSINVETRAYVTEYAEHEISSPGEPGVTYIMGGGFAKTFPEDSPQMKGQADLRNGARTRNIELIDRVNSKIADIAIDYEQDVVPLTPTGSATERHIITAYINKAKTVFEESDKLSAFWSDVLGLPADDTTSLIASLPDMEEKVRAKLVKSGGLGYQQPSPDTFPPVEDFLNWIASCGAVPMIAWLDGTTSGEADPKALLECLRSKGGAALNIIPDRNWNIADPDTKALKLGNLNDIVAIANDMDLPINIGTEMNKLGLPFLDDLDCDALRPHKEIFLSGAKIMVGHTLLLRYADYSYVGEQAAAEFASVKDKNSFFESVGGLKPVTLEQAKALSDMGPEKALDWFHTTI
jgi:hypothetical protein